MIKNQLSFLLREWAVTQGRDNLDEGSSIHLLVIGCHLEYGVHAALWVIEKALQLADKFFDIFVGHY